MKIRTIKPKSKKEMKSEMPMRDSYPGFHIDTEHLPEAKKWDIGSEHMLVLKVKQTEISQHKDYGSANFDITGIGVVEKKGDFWDEVKKDLTKKNYDKKS